MVGARPGPQRNPKTTAIGARASHADSLLAHSAQVIEPSGEPCAFGPGGEVGAEGETDRGATFRLTLPG